MKKSVLMTIISILTLLFLTSCQSRSEASPNIKENKHEGVELIIDIKHFKGKLCQQKVSPLVYKNIDQDELHLFIQEPEYVRHHSLKLMEKGKCDNTVQKINGKKAVYLCGGHTSAKR